MFYPYGQVSGWEGPIPFCDRRWEVGTSAPQASPLSNGSTYPSPDSFTWLLEEVMGEVHERIHSIKLSLCQGIVIINTNQVSYSYN